MLEWREGGRGEGWVDRRREEGSGGLIDGWMSGEKERVVEGCMNWLRDGRREWWRDGREAWIEGRRDQRSG